MSIQKLKAYEAKFDSLVQGLPLYTLPVRSLLSSLHLLADSMFNGTRLLPDSVPDPEKGKSAAGRFSYLMPLFMGCDAEQVGESALDAIEAVNQVDPGHKQLRLLLGYSHFCELMPEVHRGYYVVEGDEQSGFLLQHPSKDFSDHEAIDIVLTELSLSLYIEPPEDLTIDLFDRLADMLFWGGPRPDIEEALGRLSQHYRRYFNDPPILTEEGYRAAAGVGTEEFVHFRAALAAMADFARGLASAIERRMRREGDLDNPHNKCWKELLEWITVCWKVEPFFGLLGQLSGLGRGKLNRLVTLFSIDFRRGKQLVAHARDGFFPPIGRLEGTVLYNPDLLRLFLTARNIIFAVRHQDAKLFDDVVSQHLEPALLGQAVELLRADPRLVLVTEYSWGDGEIDLLVYSPEENVALHVQAKAAIPPSGARMVQAIESRAKEGLEQLNRLRELGQDARDAVLTKALGRSVAGVKVIDVLLSRSCLGTTKVWSQLGAVVPLNLTLLAGVTKPCRSEKKVLSLAAFPDQVWGEISRVMGLAHPQWVMKDTIMGPVTVRQPMLEYDNVSVMGAGIRMWSDS